MWLALLLAGTITVILFVPVRLCLRLNGGRPAWDVRIAWPGGWLGVGWSGAGRYLFLGRLRWQLSSNPVKPAKLAAGGEQIYLWSRTADSWRRSLNRLLGAAWRAARFSAQGTIVYGFADPALTAWLHGLVCALGSKATFSATADFSRVGWDGDLEIACSLRLRSILWPAVCLAIVYWRTRKCEGSEKLWQVQV